MKDRREEGEDQRGGGWFWAHNRIFDVCGRMRTPDGKKALLGAHALLVYLALCRHADTTKDRASFPSHATLAEETGMSRRQVQRSIERLAKAGLITKELRKGAGRRLSSNRYTIIDLSNGDCVAHRDMVGESIGMDCVAQEGIPIEGIPTIKGRQPFSASGECTPCDHKRLMALYREAIREDEGVKKGKELSAAGKENKAARKILQMGFMAEEAMECYRYYKRDPFWRDKHLSLAYIAENISAWKEAKDEEHRRVPVEARESREEEDYYAQHFRSAN